MDTALNTLPSVNPAAEDIPFLDPPSEDFFCPVTRELLHQPHLTSCCGQHLSALAVTKTKVVESRPCPMCMSCTWDTMLNKHFQRQVRALQVVCRYEDRGCVWEGELSALSSHTESCPMRDAAPLCGLQYSSMKGEKCVVSGGTIFEPQVFQYSGRKLDFIWEEAGISLHFPAASYNEGIKISVQVLTNVEENCIMPKGYRFMPIVSAVYKITTSAKLSVPVRLRMQHCAVVNKEDTLVHMVAQGTAPYRFKPYREGKFPLGELYGEVELTHFSVWTILARIPGINIYLALHVVYFSDSTAHLAMTKNIPSHKKAVQENYDNATEIESYTMNCFFFTTAITFSEANPNDEEKWTIKMAPKPSNISINDICAFDHGGVIPNIKLKLKWTGGELPKAKDVDIRVKGGNIDKTIPISCKPPQPQIDEPQLPTQLLHLQSQTQDQTPEQITRQTVQHAPVTSNDPLDCRPTLPLLQQFPISSSGVINIFSKIGTHCHDLGIILLKDEEGDITECIEAQFKSDPQRIAEAILKKWLKGTGRAPQSWDTLITVLGEIELKQLAQKIKDNLPQALEPTM